MNPGIDGTLWLPRLAALLSGAALPLAFAPFDLWLLAPLALAVLFWLWSSASPREAGKLGYAFGLGLFGVGTSWIFVSMHHFGEAIVPVAGLITLVFAAFMAIFPALSGWLAARLAAEKSTLRLLLAMPLGWMLFELVRGEFLGGFPWLNLGASQIHSPLAGYVPVLGEYGASFAVAFSAALLVLFVTRRAYLAVVGSLFALVALWAGGITLRHIDWVEATGEPLRVAIVQGNVEQSRKFDPQVFQATLDLYRRLTESVPDARLIVWPETAVPDTVSAASPFLIEMQELMRARGQDLVLGIFDQDRLGNYYNAMLALPVEGGYYHKRHLVPFGEYLPLRELILPFKSLIQVPMSDLTSGKNDQPLLNLAGQPVGASICYEATLARKINTALPAAAFLINASNDAWFGDSLAPHQHLQIAAMRSLESGRWMVRATNTGISALIDPQGRITARTPQFEQAVLQGEITPMQGATPFVRFGAWPVWLFSVLGVLALAGWNYITAERSRR
ncbi:MAG: apolipoprotein N-acyltransferase [Pseudomonadota bacterium]